MKYTGHAHFFSQGLSVRCAVVAQEKHADGTPHIHVGLWLKSKLVVTRPDYFDCLGGKHGDYETMRSTQGTWEYLRKEDGDPAMIGNLIFSSYLDYYEDLCQDFFCNI